MNSSIVSTYSSITRLFWLQTVEVSLKKVDFLKLKCEHYLWRLNLEGHTAFIFFLFETFFEILIILPTKLQELAGPFAVEMITG